MKLTYIKKNLRKGEGFFIITHDNCDYPAPKCLNRDTHLMTREVMHGYAICKSIEIESTISLLNYIKNSKILRVKNELKYRIKAHKEQCYKEKANSILSRYIGEYVFVYELKEFFYYDEGITVYSTAEKTINEIYLEFKYKIKASDCRTQLFTKDDISEGCYYHFDRHKINCIGSI